MLKRIRFTSFHILSFSLCVFLSFGASFAKATIVRFETSLGDVDVNLYDESTPLTVANFLSYVESESYDGTMIHRSIPGFIIQGGGFGYGGVDTDGVPIVTEVLESAPVSNEPVFSNVRASIAMAKISGDPDSATSQWFFNLSDNSANLDFQNEGFTVFGEVVSGMDIVDQIAALDSWDISTAFIADALTDTPLLDYTSDDANNGVLPDETHLLTLTQVSVIDTAVDSASDLDPEPILVADDNGSGSGGGSLSEYLILLMLSGLLFKQARRFAVE